MKISKSTKLIRHKLVIVLLLFIPLLFFAGFLSADTGIVTIAAITPEPSGNIGFIEEIIKKVKAARDLGADIVCFPTDFPPLRNQPIPGPVTDRIADVARQNGLYITACLRELKDGNVYQTSVLFDRTGEIIGKYRQTHKLPNEQLTLGTCLPVFHTDFGAIALKSGSDIFFPEVDLIYALKGAKIIIHTGIRPAQLQNEHLELLISGRAVDFGVYQVCIVNEMTCKGVNPPARPLPSHALIAGSSGGLCSCPLNERGLCIAAVSKQFLEGENPATKHIQEWELHSLFSMKISDNEPIVLKSRIRAVVVPGSLPFDEIINQLDGAGRDVADIVCLPEYPWSGYEQFVRLRKISKKAAQYRMHVVIGVGHNHDVILFGRDGSETSRCLPANVNNAMPPTNRESMLPLYETDLGKIGILSYSGMQSPLLSRIFALNGARIVCLPIPLKRTLNTDECLILRRRSLDNGNYTFIAASPSTAGGARSMIIDRNGLIKAAADYSSPDRVFCELKSSGWLLLFPFKSKPSESPRNIYQAERLQTQSNHIPLTCNPFFNQRRRLLYMKELENILQTLQ